MPAGVDVPEAPPRSGPDYDTDWARRYPARLARAALVETVGRGLVTALARPQVSGLDRLALADRDHGPVIFAANHHSHVDTPVLLTAIPDTWRHRLFVGGAADYFFRTRLTSALSALAIGAIPIERTRVSRRSADRSARLIDAGWSMLIFPEGGRSPDGWGQPFHGGAAYLALRCGVPVVPIHLHGTGRILRKGKRWPTPPVRHHPARRGGAGRRGHDRLVVGPTPRPCRRVARADRAVGPCLASRLGPRGRQRQAPPPTPSLARGVEAERIGQHVGTEQYGICSVTPRHTARPPLALTTVNPDDVPIRSGP
jgi:1-acyl-sn-glycerol-3-phosphate acyltransferase